MAWAWAWAWVTAGRVGPRPLPARPAGRAGPEPPPAHRAGMAASHLRSVHAVFGCLEEWVAGSDRQPAATLAAIGG